ncbi:MAG TPA: hypothetical protein VGC41_22810, partial [Kofleriaceae bacterium]
MTDEERIARELRDQLGTDARLVGAGVHWSVEVGRAERCCKVFCFSYDDVPALELGMNRGNAREGLGPTRIERHGAEYLVRFVDADRRIAGGRTQDRDAVIVAVRAWLAGSSLADVERVAPFVDRTLRRMRDLLAV